MDRYILRLTTIRVLWIAIAIIFSNVLLLLMQPKPAPVIHQFYIKPGMTDRHSPPQSYTDRNWWGTEQEPHVWPE